MQDKMAGISEFSVNLSSASRPPHQIGGRIRIVLTTPRFAPNVGATSRVCANFQVSELVVVNPQCDWSQGEPQKLAVGVASDYLSGARILDSVEQAVSGCELAIGFTRREGEHRQSTLELADLAHLIHRSRAKKVSLVFGNEETGLTDEELIPCSHFCRIPTGESLPSMNLSHAVAVVTARVFDDLSRLTEAPLITESGRITQPVPAPIEEMHGFFEHWRELLIQCGLTEAGNPDRLVRRLERLFYRVQPSLREVRFLRGILRKAQYWIVRGRNAHLP